MSSKKLENLAQGENGSDKGKSCVVLLSSHKLKAMKRVSNRLHNVFILRPLNQSCEAKYCVSRL